VPLELQVADFFTKAQTREQHQLHLLKLNASHPPSPPWVWRRVLSMAHMDPPSLPSPSCSPSGNSFHFPCVHANQASSDTNQSSFLLKTPINHRFYFLRTTIIYWYTSIYVVACFLRISIMYIAAIWEIMTTSNHLVSPFFFLRWLQPQLQSLYFPFVLFTYQSWYIYRLQWYTFHYPLSITTANRLPAWIIFLIL